MTTIPSMTPVKPTTPVVTPTNDAALATDDDFFLQVNPMLLAKGTPLWEEVSEYVYENADKIINNDAQETPRYSGNKAKRTAKGISIDAKNLSDQEQAIVLRMLGVTANVSSAVGYVRKPEYVKVKGRKHSVLHEVATGKSFKTTPAN